MVVRFNLCIFYDSTLWKTSFKIILYPVIRFGRWPDGLSEKLKKIALFRKSFNRKINNRKKNEKITCEKLCRQIYSY